MDFKANLQIFSKKSLIKNDFFAIERRRNSLHLIYIISGESLIRSNQKKDRDL